jgi:hypothetical protein
MLVLEFEFESTTIRSSTSTGLRLSTSTSTKMQKYWISKPDANAQCHLLSTDQPLGVSLRLVNPQEKQHADARRLMKQQTVLPELLRERKCRNTGLLSIRSSLRQSPGIDVPTVAWDHSPEKRFRTG